MLTRQAARLSASNEVWSIFRPLDGHTQYTITDAIPTAREAALPSFDHLVCSGNYRVWKVDFQRLRSFHIDDQLEVTRPFDRQISRSATFQNLHHVHSKPAHRILDVWSVRK